MRVCTTSARKVGEVEVKVGVVLNFRARLARKYHNPTIHKFLDPPLIREHHRSLQVVACTPPHLRYLNSLKESLTSYPTASLSLELCVSSSMSVLFSII